MANEMAKLEILLEAQTAQFTQGMNQAINQIKRTQDQMRQQGAALNGLNTQFKSVTETVGLMGRALAVLGGVGYLKGLIDAADAASDMGDAFGIAIGRIYGMSNAIQEAGGKGEGLQSILQKLSNNVDDAFEGSEKAREAFSRLGITLQSIQKSSIDEIYVKIAKALAGIEDPAKRNAIAMELMGKSAVGTDWAKHNKVLEETREKYEALSPALQNAADYSEKLTVATKTFATYVTATLGAVPDTIRKIGQGFKDLYNVIAGNKTLEEALTVVTNENTVATNENAKAKENQGRVIKATTEETKAAAKAIEDMNKAIAKAVEEQIAWEKKIVDSLNPFNQLAEDLNRLQIAYESGRISAEQYADATFKLYDATEKFTEKKTELDEMGVAMGNLVASGVGDLADVFFEANKSFSDFAANFLKQIAKMILQAMILKTIKTGLAGTGFGAFLGFAKGGAFSSHTGLPYGVYTKPTYFDMPGSGPLTKFAKGGVLGEAGPEAIMPLSRGNDGKLGVAAAPVKIEVNNYSSATVETAETTNSDGSKQVVMTIRNTVKDMFGDGSMDKTMRVAYGLSRSAV
jgi:hypothetical protein